VIFDRDALARHQAAHRLTSEDDETAHQLFWSTLDAESRARAKGICEAYGGGDFDEGFLGFMGTYMHLARLIPLDRVVYDVGCAHAFQAWFFREHRGYVGISDSPGIVQRFWAPGVTHVHGSVAQWALGYGRDAEGRWCGLVPQAERLFRGAWITTAQVGEPYVQTPLDSCHFAIHNFCPSGHADVLRIFHDFYTFYPRSA